MSQLLQARPYTAWELIKSFWQSEQRFFVYISFLFILLLTLTLIGFDVVFSYWYNYFYDALQFYKKDQAIKLLLIFFGLAAIYIVVAVYRFYLSQTFMLRWRRWLTNQFIARWLEKKSYYYLENFDKSTDNPDQRIQEDVGAIVAQSIELFFGVISAAVTFLAFIYILWTLSGVIKIPLGQWGMVHLHGYLVWVAIIYNALGTYFAFKIGHPLVALNFEQQKREATFRFAAVDLRSHAEHVALYRGENQEKKLLGGLFNGVLENWFAIILRQKKLLWFTAGFNQLAVALPLLVILPNYFDKVFLLGGLMQSIRAFANVQESLSYLLRSYTTIAEWRAVTQRLLTFLNHMQEVEKVAEENNQLQYRPQAQNKIATEQLTLFTPRGQVLLQDVTTSFVHGQNYLIKGRSGIGKSTLVRTLANIWPYGKGNIYLPQQQAIMYLPQKSYMPIGSFAAALRFPNNVVISDDALHAILRDCKLEDFIPRLQETATWSQQLSPGEQQRVAFARVLLQKPDWVFLDEATSSLDLENEQYFYHLLREKLPHCSLVSVGHRPSLNAFHDHTIDLEKHVK